MYLYMYNRNKLHQDLFSQTFKEKLKSKGNLYNQIDFFTLSGLVCLIYCLYWFHCMETILSHSRDAKACSRAYNILTVSPAKE